MRDRAGLLTARSRRLADSSRLARYRRGCTKSAATCSLEESDNTYVQSGLSNARNEGINSKIRTVTRRAYGFHSASSLISYIILCCSGIYLEPAFNYPFAYH